MSDFVPLRGRHKDHRVASIADLSPTPLRKKTGVPRNPKFRGGKIGFMCQRVLDYICSCSHSPTFREIGDAVGLSSMSSVHAHVESLKAEGYLEPTKPGANRRLVPTNRRDHLTEALAIARVVAAETSREDVARLVEHLENLVPKEQGREASSQKGGEL